LCHCLFAAITRVVPALWAGCCGGESSWFMPGLLRCGGCGSGVSGFGPDVGQHHHPQPGGWWEAMGGRRRLPCTRDRAHGQAYRGRGDAQGPGWPRCPGCTPRSRPRNRRTSRSGLGSVAINAVAGAQCLVSAHRWLRSREPVVAAGGGPGGRRIGGGATDAPPRQGQHHRRDRPPYSSPNPPLRVPAAGRWIRPSHSPPESVQSVTPSHPAVNPGFSTDSD
jgi:hypothetical protein